MTFQNPLFSPGPTNLPEQIRHAMHIPSQDHRAEAFAEILIPLLEDTRQIFGTEEGKVLLYASSGTGGWEAAISNTLSAGDRVLLCRNGAFSHRWLDMCQRFGLDVEVIEAAWGAAAPAEKYAEALTADKSFKAVMVTHNETATAVRSDIASIRAAMNSADSDALLMVDGVSSIGSMDFQMDVWGVDIAVCGSQKGFMLGTGMAILAVSPKALAATASAKLPRAYFDFQDMLTANAAGSFPYTPPLQLISGLRESVNMLLTEGLENVFARHFRYAEGVRRAIQAWGLRQVPHSSDIASDTVSAVYAPEGQNANALIDHCNQSYGVSYAIGLGELAGKVFRIGHLGAMSEPLMLSGLATIEMGMKDMGYGIALGSGVAAAQDYYRKGKVTIL